MILLAPPSHRLTPDALALCCAHFETDHFYDVDEQILLSRHPELLVSFLNRQIIRSPSLLAAPNINLHPAPPAYPGVGGASRALFDGASLYGATAHMMSSAVDAGEIIDVAEFPISEFATCETLFAQAERACLSLLGQCLENFKRTRTLQPQSSWKWSGRAMTRKEFDRWLVLDPQRPEEFTRKIRAAAHSKLSGPYVEMHGHRFAMVPR